MVAKNTMCHSQDFYCCDKVPLPKAKANWEGKETFQLTVCSLSTRDVRARTQARKHYAETNAEAAEDCCLLAFS